MLQSGYFIGLMSGTSLDGIDAVLVKIESAFETNQPVIQNQLSFQNQLNTHNQLKTQIVSSLCQPLPNTIKASLQHLSESPLTSLSAIGELDQQLSQAFANAVNSLLSHANIAATEVQAIGCHGVTLWHQPKGEFGFSMQLTNPNRLAQLTGIDVVSDFRNMDIAAGGQGAPLVPAFHKAIFAGRLDKAIILNLGGIANITVIHPNKPLLGYDTGPANTLMNLWCERHKQQAYDANGDWAAAGKLDSSLLANLMSEPYFQQAFPKSTGKELFNLNWLDTVLKNAKLAQNVDYSANDIQTALAHLTAKSVATQLNLFEDISTVLVCGGGVHNQFVVNKIQDYAKQKCLYSTQEYGVDPDLMEAMAFAWLAYQRINANKTELSTVTGARVNTVLGAWYCS